ncbi:FAD-dependent pyridine nucleotide-disulfide oxidoreductase [Nitzschia inconspicua]|uniref:FAD-dependent pyridine nucleotide-disulfide oxidoreductase n=1 Tax=Nitzschia inconspicua TaxID=303405 RepID=A0A9K3LSI4_9STRA|nr:FAD-dependent pyridine nucleotide-disulfide oxidoreductase [Nitzschia inconspicua]
MMKSTFLYVFLLIRTLTTIRSVDAFVITTNNKKAIGIYSSPVCSMSRRIQKGNRNNRHSVISLRSTEKEMSQDTESEQPIPEECTSHTQKHQTRKNFFEIPTEMETHELGEEEEESNVKRMKEDLVITNDEDFKNDKIMKLMRSEVGVKEVLQRSEFETWKGASFLPDSSNLPLDVLMERTLDTFEDVAVHLRRIPYENGGQLLTKEEDATRKTVVVLGSGWAAHALMKVVDCRKIRLVIVSPVNHFVFTPMLASASVGTVEYRSMTEAVRSTNPCMEAYFEGKAIDLDLENKTVTVKLNKLLDGVREGESPQLELSYDHLVVSVGCKVDGRGVPGVEKCLRLKTLDDARKLRQSLCETFEYASRPEVAGPDASNERTKRATIAICGGGPTGVELAGEVMDLARDITRKHKGSYANLAGDIRVVLVHGGSELVPQFNKSLRAEALRTLKKQGVEVILNTRVTEVTDGKIKLSQRTVDDDGNVSWREESELPVGLTVWAAGTKPVEFTEKLLSQLPEGAGNSDGRIKVDKWMRPHMPKEELLGTVFVLGDAAAFPEGNVEIAYDQALPQTAQVAGQQGAYLARLLSRGYNLNVTPPSLPRESEIDSQSVFYDPLTRKWLEVRGLTDADKFVFLNLGLLAYLGGGEALTQVQLGDVPIFSYFGSIAFVLWRSVYLVKQVATRNRILVTFDWLKSALFERDLTRF